jgi:hypothetical protein
MKERNKITSFYSHKVSLYIQFLPNLLLLFWSFIWNWLPVTLKSSANIDTIKQKLQYLNIYNNGISFIEEGDAVMINATQMAKPFGKTPAEWLRLPPTIELMRALSIMGKSHNRIIIKNGRPDLGGGTLMNEYVVPESTRQIERVSTAHYIATWLNTWKSRNWK